MALSEKVVRVRSAVLVLVSAICLSVALPASAQQPPDRRAEAERLATAGAYAAALTAFQAIAAANPDDIDARLWIARLHGKLGHPEHAADVYRSVLAAQPQNLDALIGLGNALVALGRLTEAGEALNRAEAISGDGPAVLAAQGRLHAAANRTTLALAYYLRAMSLDPSNTDVRAAADALRALRAHRLELDYDFQRQNVDTADAHVGTIDLNARLSDAWRVFVRAQAQSAFGSDEQRAGAGVEWNVTRRARIRAGALAGIDAVYLPEVDGFVEASVVRGRVRWSAQLRGTDFEGADLWIGGPGLAVMLSNGGELSVDYYRGSVTSPGFSGATTTDTVALRLQGPVARRARASIGYTHGIDRLDWLTIDRIAFESDTLSLRGAFDFTPFTSFEAGYDFQSRPGGVNVHRARAGLVFRF